MDVWLTSLLLLLLFVLFLVVRRPSGFPRGPLVGILTELSRSDSKPKHIRYHDMMKDYGKVLGLVLFNMRIIIIGDYNVAKEVFRRDEVTARPSRVLTNARAGQKEYNPDKSFGILWASGKNWHDNRRFSLRNFRDLGFGKDPAQHAIHGQASLLVEQLASQNGRKISLKSNVFALHVLNVVWAFLTGKTFNHDDPDLHKIATMVRQVIHTNLGQSLLSYLPFMIRLFPEWTGYNTAIHLYDTIREVIMKELELHEKTFDPDNLQTFLDVYLMQIRENKDNDSFTKEQLTVISLDLFLAGFETTTSTLMWAVVLMAMYPDVQEKVFHELHNNLPGSVLPNMEEKKNLPYTEAVLSEVQRYGTIAPLALPHVATSSVNAAGYYFPKGSVIISSLYSIHNDVDYWKDPDVFRPERFLNHDQTAYVHNERICQFGIGKRICMGESLARMEVFLFFTAMLQKLKFSLPEDEPPPSLKRPEGVTCAPNTCKILVNTRDFK
ncbi:methyl farnesoate epoxidase-like [Oratosquilla oratoria]|uniref:methyl farnesoate epoxidase-like n=1 Tax=Oratosquilla oratoria TaxID=337810 RepID=UPI003F7683A8